MSDPIEIWCSHDDRGPFSVKILPEDTVLELVRAIKESPSLKYVLDEFMLEEITLAKVNKIHFLGAAVTHPGCSFVTQSSRRKLRNLSNRSMRN